MIFQNLGIECCQRRIARSTAFCRITMLERDFQIPMSVSTISNAPTPLKNLAGESHHDDGLAGISTACLLALSLQVPQSCLTSTSCACVCCRDADQSRLGGKCL